jgi:hypothetical protein
MIQDVATSCGSVCGALHDVEFLRLNVGMLVLHAALAYASTVSAVSDRTTPGRCRA